MNEPVKSAETDETAQDLSGRTLGDFQLLRRLGQGGMGQVYLARQLSLKREVALKILRKELAENVTALKRFQAEAEAVARISHPNIVQVYSIGEQEGLRFMALEYVEGRNLREYLDRKGPPDLNVAITLMKQVAAALQRASELGLVHRDIKPENILLNRKAEVKVTDFGLSRYFAGGDKPLSLTQSGMTLGTPLYMSPEQVQGRIVDHRSDLYSFGITCYHMLVGRPPFKGSTAFDVAIQHVQGNPEPIEQIRPDLPEDLCLMVHKLMAKKVEDRYQSAKDVLRDLNRIQKGLKVELPREVLGISTTSAVPLPSGVHPLHVSLSGTSISGVSVGQGTSAMSVVSMPPANRRWPVRVVLATVTIGFLVGGWWIYHTIHPKVSAATLSNGNVDTRFPETVVSSHETQLKELFNSRSSGSQHLKYGVQLGTYYINEKRFDEAEKVFNELETGKPILPVEIPNLHQAMGKFGKAIILAWKDKPKESVDLFSEAVKKIPIALYRKGVEKFFYENTEFAEAIAEALNRDAENLTALTPPEKLPATLLWLRTPSGLMTGPGR